MGQLGKQAQFGAGTTPRAHSISPAEQGTSYSSEMFPKSQTREKNYAVKKRIGQNRAEPYLASTDGWSRPETEEVFCFPDFFFEGVQVSWE